MRGVDCLTKRSTHFADNLLELDVVTGDGRIVTCSPVSEPDLFDAMRGGFAQCGVITRATLRRIRAPRRVHRFQLFYPDLLSLTADQRRVLAENRFDQLQGAIIPDPGGAWRYQLDGAIFYGDDAAPDDKAVLQSLSDNRRAAVVTDLSFHDDALAFAKLAAILKSNGPIRNPGCLPSCATIALNGLPVTS